MISTPPSNAKPVSAFDLIMHRLTALNVFAPTPVCSDAAHFARAGALCATTAANIVARIASDKRLDREAKTKAGGEALVFATMADLLMRHAAEVEKGSQ